MTPRISTVLAGLLAAAVLDMGAAGAIAVPAGTAAPGSASAPARTAEPVRATLAASQCLGDSRLAALGEPWAQRQLNPSAVWGMSQGAGQTVAVLDSGVSATVPALAGAVLPGQNVGTGQAADTDCTGHGTFVAGLIAARRSAAGVMGMAPQATILPVDVTGADGSVTSASVAAGIMYATANGATIIDFSAASTPAPSAALGAAVAFAEARNVIVIAWVASTGNGLGNGANQVSYPAGYPGVLAVSATDPSGLPLSGGTPGVPVDLAAPGGLITSIGPVGSGVQTGGGAAVATGFVAGTAALVRSYYPALTAAQVVSRMEATAAPLGTSLPDPAVGYGIVDPWDAMTEMLNPAGAARVAATPEPHLPALARPHTWPVRAAELVCFLVLLALACALAVAHIARNARQRAAGAPGAHRATSSGQPPPAC